MPVRPITQLTTQQLRDFARELHSQASAIERAMEESDAAGLSALQVRNFASCKKGIAALSVFNGAVWDALGRSKLEQSLGDETAAGTVANALRQASGGTPPDRKKKSSK